MVQEAAEGRAFRLDLGERGFTSGGVGRVSWVEGIVCGEAWHWGAGISQLECPGDGWERLGGSFLLA